MGYELDMESNGYDEQLKLEWKVQCIILRAEEIARETRIKLGEEHRCHGFDIQCDCELPEFQAELHPAHNFNKYLMEQRMRYQS